MSKTKVETGIYVQMFEVLFNANVFIRLFAI